MKRKQVAVTATKQEPYLHINRWKESFRFCFPSAVTICRNRIPIPMVKELAIEQWAWWGDFTVVEHETRLDKQMMASRYIHVVRWLCCTRKWKNPALESTWTRVPITFYTELNWCHRATMKSCVGINMWEVSRLPVSKRRRIPKPNETRMEAGRPFQSLNHILLSAI